MDISFLIIGLLFAVSTAGVPMYSYVMRRHFVRQRAHFIIQGLFWFMISAASLFNMLLSENTISLILNNVLVFVGFVFGSYAITRVLKDDGSYLLPYAKTDNKEAFAKYVTSLDVELIKVKSMSPNKYDIVDFAEITGEQKETIMNEIVNNPDIVDAFGSADANKRLIRSFTFALFIIILGFVI